MLHVGQLHELTLPVPHLLCDHLAQPHRILIHLQPGGLGTWGWGEEGGGGGGGGKFTEKLFKYNCQTTTRDYLQTILYILYTSRAVLGKDPDLVENVDHLSDELRAQLQHRLLVYKRPRPLMNKS